MTTNRIASFDCIKAICIIFVILVHIDVILPESINPFTTLHYELWAQTCVPIFLIVSGFLWAMSSHNKKVNTITDWFRPNKFKPKLMRILFPYMLIFALEVILIILSKGFDGVGTPISFTYYFLSGGWGRGNYYITILIQLLILFPIIHYYFKKFPLPCSIIIVSIQLLFEVLTSVIPIPAGVYRLCIARYLICILFGIILYYYGNKINWKLILVSFLIGLVFLIGKFSLDWSMPVFNNWSWSALPAAFYDFALAVILLYLFRKLETKKNKITQKFVSLLSHIGEASYHIYLVQMIWFGFFIGISYKYVNNLLPCAIVITIVVSVIFCCMLGVLYYNIDKKYLQFPILYK